MKLTQFILLTFALGVAGAETATKVVVPPDHAQRMEHGLDMFRKAIRPLLIEHCVKCHGGERTRGDFDLTTREGLLRGGAEGPSVTLYDGRSSRLYPLVSHTQEPPMPPKAEKLPETALRQIAAWIDNGAPYDRLLDSPRYGERWARHWLDVARFAESSGFEHDNDRPNAYHSFAARLAEAGFVTFAPSVMFPPNDSLVRKCNSVGLTQYSYIAAMHQQIVNWLRTQPFVAGDRIGLYGLSWGGKTAMRMPLLMDGYAMTIVSGDFNEWIWKTSTNDSGYSHVFQPEPYIFEFGLGSTYGYAEMAALIAARPFMVERGHFDPVGTDQQVGFEFAKVQHLYNAQLKLPENCAIEWFVGGHEINLGETFKFLHRHLGPVSKN
jgi:mono/diheme cytochrome c family protein